jgi:hypothetical protein
MPCRLLSLPPIFVLLLSLVPPAALPPLPIVEDVPAGPVEVPPVPSVDADVPPAAPLPAVPPVAAEPEGPLLEPPAPTLDALWPKAEVTGDMAMPALRTPARRADLSFDLII